MGTFERDTQLFDMHCHLSFVDDAQAVRACLRESGVRALSCTVTPAEYEQGLEAFAGVPACTVALGLHPWQVADGACGTGDDELKLERAMKRFEELAPSTRFIGEIGLDYRGTRGEAPSRQLQQAYFDLILQACEAVSRFPRKLISLHASSNVTSDVLDMLERRCNMPARHDCIFHWFQGTSEDLKRARELGCYFSMGPRMLATKRGAEYARIVPLDRLLLETDSPAHPGDAWSCEAWLSALAGALDTIAEIRSESEDKIARVIAETSERLLRG